MDKSTKKNRNYEKTEIAIKDALVKLCSDKNSLQQVTVKELCELANISKSTFYLHYPEIQSIFESIGDKFLLTFEVLLNELLQNTKTDFLIFIKRLFTLINESSDLIKIGLTFEMPFNYYIKGIKEQLKKTVENYAHFSNIANKNKVLVETQIVTSGIIDFVVELLKNNNLEELDKYATIINDFLNKWIASIENRY